MPIGDSDGNTYSSGLIQVLKRLGGEDMKELQDTAVPENSTTQQNVPNLFNQPYYEGDAFYSQQPYKGEIRGNNIGSETKDKDKPQNIADISNTLNSK
jgi:hypothetical protein